MNNNQGLEALAALASAVPASGGSSHGDDSNKQSGNNNNNNNGGSSSVAGSTDNNSTSSGTTPGAAVSQIPGLNLALQSLQGVSPQQLQQLLAAATNTNINNNIIPGPQPPQQPNHLALFSGLQQLQQQQQQHQGDQSAALVSMQQKINYLQMLAQAQQGNRPQVPAPVTMPGTNGGLDQTAQALALALAGRGPPAFLTSFLNNQNKNTQVLPTVQATNHSGNSSTSMPPPPPAASSQPISVNTAGIPSPNAQQHAKIAPQPSRSNNNNNNNANRIIDMDGPMDDKKQMKRAANRKSAQLSRKRKKLFIEELKDENDSLRRKEQILRSIPDLVVVFDSSGKLWFVSESVSRFLDFTSNELEGTSFWSRLCDDSVRLLKAAFMDSLAARQPDSDTAPLGSGFWELRLVDKDGSQKIITLNGVVHFAGDRPECVCSIRPQEDDHNRSSKRMKKDAKQSTSAAVATNTANTAANNNKATVNHNHKSLIKVEPQQSVVSNDRSDSSSSSRRVNNKEAIRISDSGNSSGSSGCSDSGSSDELNTDTVDTTA